LNLIDHDEYCGIFQPILSFFEFLFQPASMQTKNIMIFDRIEIAASAYYTTMKFRRGRARQAKTSSITLFGYFPSVQQNILKQRYQ